MKKNLIKSISFVLVTVLMMTMLAGYGNSNKTSRGFKSWRDRNAQRVKEKNINLTRAEATEQNKAASKLNGNAFPEGE